MGKTGVRINSATRSACDLIECSGMCGFDWEGYVHMLGPVARNFYFNLNGESTVLNSVIKCVSL